MNLQEKKRFSSIELLKLIAMLMVVISHSAPYYGSFYAESYIDLRMSTDNIQNLLLIFFVYLGQIGNCIFLVCSAYFLLEQDTVKGKKVAYLLADCLFFSLGFLCIFLYMGFEIPKMEIIKQFFPTTFEYNWFVGCYILLYAIHPALNKIIHGLSQRQLLAANLIGIGLYSVLQMIVRDSFYYTRFIGFILIYFLMAYCKKYLKNTSKIKSVNWILLVGSTALLIGLILATNVLGKYFDTFHGKMLHYCIFVNPLIVILAFSIFHLFKEWNFENKRINGLASVSLYIYIIHENYLFASYARPMYFEYVYQIYSYKYVAVWSLALALVCFVVSLFIGWLYRISIGRLIHRICDRLVLVVTGIGKKCLEYLLRWN